MTTAAIDCRFLSEYALPPHSCGCDGRQRVQLGVTRLSPLTSTSTHVLEGRVYPSGTMAFSIVVHVE